MRKPSVKPFFVNQQCPACPTPTPSASQHHITKTNLKIEAYISKTSSCKTSRPDHVRPGTGVDADGPAKIWPSLHAPPPYLPASPLASKSHAGRWGPGRWICRSRQRHSTIYTAHLPRLSPFISYHLLCRRQSSTKIPNLRPTVKISPLPSQAKNHTPWVPSGSSNPSRPLRAPAAQAPTRSLRSQRTASGPK